MTIRLYKPKLLLMKFFNEIRTFGAKSKSMRYELEVLSNGLALCNIKVVNPFYKNEIVNCKALIDTGADTTIVCQSIFDSFTIDKTKKDKIGISTIHENEEDVITYPLSIIIPESNWHDCSGHFTIRDISKREEYRVIIGTDILKHFILVYRGVEELAWLED